ncbi:MAG: 3-isopropylmalate dehydratase [Anaerolineales bacterium]|nr:3-isopropylmalate dehydratase [Anaerolineales bacterium]
MPNVVLVLGDDISTDHIYPGRFMATVLPNETPQYAFADYPLNNKLNTGQIPPNSIIVAGENFGCGSSREQAVSALKGWELMVVAKSFARIFFQNAVNLGLRLVICPSIDAAEGDELELTDTEVINHSKGKRFPIVPLPATRQAIIDAGGLIAYTRKRLIEERQH